MEIGGNKDVRNEIMEAPIGLNNIVSGALAPPDVYQDNSSIWRTTVADIGRGFVHTAVENPVNGITQIVNRVGGFRLPELDIVSDPKNKTAGMVGGIAGNVTVFTALTVAGSPFLGSLGSGLAGATVRSAITGAVYSGILTPSDESSVSSSFWKNRGKNALISSVTFAGMTGAGFALPQARGFISNVANGAATGAFAGLVNTQADVMLNRGRILASASEYWNNSKQFALFGAGFSATQYGIKRLGELYDQMPAQSLIYDSKRQVPSSRPAHNSTVATRTETIGTVNHEDIIFSDSYFEITNYNHRLKFVEKGKNFLIVDEPKTSGSRATAYGWRGKLSVEVKGLREEPSKLTFSPLNGEPFSIKVGNTIGERTTPLDNFYDTLLSTARKAISKKDPNSMVFAKKLDTPPPVKPPSWRISEWILPYMLLKEMMSSR